MPAAIATVSVHVSGGQLREGLCFAQFLSIALDSVMECFALGTIEMRPYSAWLARE
jgi:hypothetical protein